MSGVIQARLRAADLTDRILRSVNHLIIYVSVGILLSALATNVLLRYALEQGGAAWLSELPEHVFPWMVAAGVVLGALQGAHIAVEIVLFMLSERAAKILALLIQLSIAGAYAVLAVVAVNVANIVSIEYSSLLGLSRSWGYYALVYMSVGLVIVSLILTIRVLVHGRSAIASTGSVSL